MTRRRVGSRSVKRLTTIVLNSNLASVHQPMRGFSFWMNGVGKQLSMLDESQFRACIERQVRDSSVLYRK